MRKNIQIPDETRRGRKRQFSNLRQSRSSSKYIGDSQLTKSLIKSRHNRQFNNQRSCHDRTSSRISNIQNQQSRYNKQPRYNQQSRYHNHNQSHALRQRDTVSPRNQAHSQSHPHNNLMCVCCYNKKQAQLKRKRQSYQRYKNQQQTIQLAQNLIKSNRYKQQLYQSHVKHNINQMTEYNKMIMQKHQRQKRLQQQRKNQDQDQMRQHQEYLVMEKQNRQKHMYEQRELLKRKLQEQMQMKQYRKRNQKQNFESNNNAYIIDSIIAPRQVDPQSIKRIRSSYKQQLLQQIQDRKQKRQKQVQDRAGVLPGSDINQFQLVTFAQKRNQQARKISSKLKQNILDEIKQKKVKQESKKVQVQQQRQQLQKQRRTVSRQNQQQNFKKQQLRRKNIDNYLTDLRSQIQENKRKRIQQMEWINERKYGEPIIPVKQIQQYEKQVCNGCEKKYPRKLLTEFVTIKDQA